MNKFYMVFVETGQGPSAIHAELHLARSEAERLCLKTGKRTFVLESIEVCVPAGVQWAKTLPSGM